LPATPITVLPAVTMMFLSPPGRLIPPELEHEEPPDDPVPPLDAPPDEDELPPPDEVPPLLDEDEEDPSPPPELDAVSPPGGTLPTEARRYEPLLSHAERRMAVVAVRAILR
jgi:hypothetical protein